MSQINRRRLISTTLAGIAALPIVALSARRAEAATHQIDIQGFAFLPSKLNVAVGDTVVFTNKDGTPHTATALDGAFDTGTIARNKTAEVTIDAAGFHEFKCNFHPAMKGTITAA